MLVVFSGWAHSLLSLWLRVGTKELTCAHRWPFIGKPLISLSVFKLFIFDWSGSQKGGEGKRLPVSRLKGRGPSARHWVGQAQVGAALYSVFRLYIPTKPIGSGRLPGLPLCLVSFIPETL